MSRERVMSSRPPVSIHVLDRPSPVNAFLRTHVAPRREAGILIPIAPNVQEVLRSGKKSAAADAVAVCWRCEIGLKPRREVRGHRLRNAVAFGRVDEAE